MSPFSNAILFTTIAPEITNVTISPTTATVAKGGTAKFIGTVEGNGLINKKGYFSIQEPVSAGTSISDDGLLIIAADETKTSYNVLYVSDANPTKTATATVTITD